MRGVLTTPKNKIIITMVSTLVVLLVLANILPLAEKRSNASASFLANWNGGSLNAFVGNGSTTAGTDTVLPDLVEGGFGGSGQAMQASRGDTLKYETASNLDNNKVEYSMQLKNKYALTGQDNESGEFQGMVGIDYDTASGYLFVVDQTAKRVIKSKMDSSVWESADLGLTDPRYIDYDPNTGYLYITDQNSVVKTKMDGSGRQKLSGFLNPQGIFYNSSDDTIYVADTGNHRIVKTKIDGTDRVNFGSSGSGVNQFSSPWDVYLDSDYLYVSDRGNQRIVKTQINGTGWTTLSVSANIKGFSGAIHYYNNYIYLVGEIFTYTDGAVTSYLKTNIEGTDQSVTSLGGGVNASYKDAYFDINGNRIYGTWNSYNGYSSTTYDIYIRSVDLAGLNAQRRGNQLANIASSAPGDVWYNDGNLYVADMGNFRTLSVKEDGTSFTSFGKRYCDSALGNFGFDASPDGIQYDPSTGIIWTHNTGSRWCPNDTRRIVKTKMDGSIWQTWAVDGNYTTGRPFYDGSQYVYWPFQSGSTGYIMKKNVSSGASSNLGGFSTNAKDVWVDSAGYLYVADTGNNRIVKTKFDGTDQTVLAGLNAPSSIQYDEPSGFIFVVDKNNNRILKTKIDGSEQTALAGFNSPQGAFYDAATDYVYVADTNNNRIVKTKMDGTGWTNMTLDPRRVLFKTQGDEMRLELDLYSQRLKFWMKKATGGIFLQSAPLNWGVDEWHKPAVYFNRATGRVELKIDDVVVDSAEDPTWTTALPSFGSSIYVSTDPANPDAVNVSPIDDFKVDVETVDVTDPANPATIHAYNTNQKATEYQNDAWSNASNPYFEFTGATDDLSGVLGYWLSFDSDPASDPISQGVYQAHSGAAGATQTYTSSANLVSGTTYYLRARTRDSDYNYSEPTTLFTYKYDGGPPSAPEYVNTSPQGCSTAPTFTFTWPKVPEEVSGLAGYEYKKGTQGTVGLVPNLNLSDEIYNYATTPYQEGDNVFYLRAKDNAGNVSGWQTSVFCSTGLAHIIDGPKVTAGPSSISVNWTSSKQTTSAVKVYEGNTYISEQGQTTFDISHNVKVVGLEPETKYRYQLVWTDSSGNLGESEWFETVTAKEPYVSNVKIDVISPTRAIVAWDSSEEATGKVQFGANTVEASAFAKSFIQNLDGLTGGSSYNLRIKSLNHDGYVFYSDTYPFQTPPIPIISNLRFQPITDQSSAGMKVTWTTNVETTSSFFYGSSGGTLLEKTLSAPTKEHEVSIIDLVDNSDYAVYAFGVDQFGNTAKSETNTFKTALDSRPPKISDLSIEATSTGTGTDAKAQIAVSFKTDESSTAQVEYGEGSSSASYASKTQEDISYSTNHVVIIGNLDPSKIYHLKAVSKDKAGNAANSEDNAVITKKPSESAFNLILQSLSKAFGWLKIFN